MGTIVPLPDEINTANQLVFSYFFIIFCLNTAQKTYYTSVEPLKHLETALSCSKGFAIAGIRIPNFRICGQQGFYSRVGIVPRLFWPCSGRVPFRPGKKT